ncbi:hypothetical protein GCM10010243_18950 [Streptomyces matensis]|nr:hypothetical protein GCM10010243_18950 [Streptomyces matensis]
MTAGGRIRSEGNVEGVRRARRGRGSKPGGGTERGENAFVASADRFAEVAAEPAAPKTAVLTHAQMEELLGADARGRPAAAP